MSERELPMSSPSWDIIPQAIEPQAEAFVANEALWLLGELGSELSQALDLETLQNILSYKLRWIFNFERCTLAVWTELADSEYLLFEITSSSSSACTPQKISLNQGWPGKVITESKPYFIVDLSQLPPLVTLPMSAETGIHPQACSLMLLPLRIGERTIGSLNFSSNRLGTYSVASWHLASLLAAQIGGQLASILLHQQTCITVKTLEKSQAQLKRDLEFREHRIVQLEEQVRRFQKLNQFKNKFLRRFHQLRTLDAQDLHPAAAVRAWHYQVPYKRLILTSNCVNSNALKTQTQSWKCVHTLTRHSSWIESVAISANGQILASGNGNSTVDLWYLGTGELIRTLKNSKGVSTVVISPDDQTLIVGSHDTTIELWHLGTGKLLRTFRGLKPISSIAISPDGQTLVSGSYDNTIELWHLNTGELLYTLIGHSDAIYAVAISPDGQTLASASHDNTIKIWHLSTGGALLRTFRGSQISSSIAISPDGQTLVSGSYDNTIELWHLNTGELLYTLIGHSDAVYAVAINPDGQTLASASHDRTIKIWHLSTGELLYTLSGHSAAVYAVAISPDGQTLASGSHDQTIKIWQCYCK